MLHQCEGAQLSPAVVADVEAAEHVRLHQWQECPELLKEAKDQFDEGACLNSSYQHYN